MREYEVRKRCEAIDEPRQQPSIAEYVESVIGRSHHDSDRRLVW